MKVGLGIDYLDVCIDMLSNLQFQVFFGEGSVGYGPNRIDLSAFNCTQSGIDKPRDRSFCSIHKWLERGFHINPETHVLTVQTLVTWANKGVLWELMPIRKTVDWKMYIEAAFERGWPLAMLVQSHEKPQVAAATEEYEGTRSAQREGEQAKEEEEQSLEVRVTETEAQGQADEGERIPRIVEQMQNEDEEIEQMQQCGDSSDKEGDPMPTEWREQGFGNPMVQDGRCPKWEYRENEVVQGSKYPTIDAVKEAVKLWSLSLRKEFRVVKCSSSTYEVKCVKDDCPLRVHAFKGRWKTHWQYSIVTEHTCYLEGVEKLHHNLTSVFIANEMYGLIVDNLAYELKMIIKHIERTFNAPSAMIRHGEKNKRCLR